MPSINNEVKGHRCDFIDITFRWVVQHIHFHPSAAICHLKKHKRWDEWRAIAFAGYVHLLQPHICDYALDGRWAAPPAPPDSEKVSQLLPERQIAALSLDVRTVRKSVLTMRALMCRGWNSWLTVFHHDHGAHLRAVTLILTLSLQSSTLPCPLSFQPPTAPSLIPQQAHSPQERIRDRLKESGLFPRVRASVPLSARLETNGQWARATRG